jgi:hypothetical protein
MNKDKIIIHLKRTVGFRESDNRNEYLKGAGMAIDQCMAEHKLIVDNMNSKNGRLQARLARVKKTVQTFGELLKWSEEDGYGE